MRKKISGSLPEKQGLQGPKGFGFAGSMQKEITIKLGLNANCCPMFLKVPGGKMVACVKMEIEVGIILCCPDQRTCSGNQFLFPLSRTPPKYTRGKVRIGKTPMKPGYLLLGYFWRTRTRRAYRYQGSRCGSEISSLEFTTLHINFNKEDVTVALQL